jgi:hypothetical protein
MARETAMNELVLHLAIHEHFVKKNFKVAIEPFVSWLYKNVFPMPLDSPTLGQESQVRLMDVADPDSNT